MTSERIDAYAKAVQTIVAAEGRADEVEDELFRFARAFEANDSLRGALTDPQLPLERRLGVVDELLGGKALTTTTAIVTFIISSGRASDLPAVVDRMVEMQTQGRAHEVAEVRSAVALDAAQEAAACRVLSPAFSNFRNSRQADRRAANGTSPWKVRRSRARRGICSGM